MSSLAARMTASVAVALLALAFTIGSFWWIWVRRGHLEAYEPQTYAGYLMGDSFRLRLPLTVYNTGARTLVATDMRAVFVDHGVTVPVITFRHSIKPLSGDVADFAHPYPVAGRQSVSKFVEFGRKDWAPNPATEYRVRVEVRTGDDGAWSELVTVNLTSPDPATASSYIAYRRDPADDAPPLPAPGE
jgi:hypothetical protein